ncbi:MAG: hypothetical protein AAGJ55_08010 [Cyanobacteria bacterium J06555_12]
MGRAQPSIQSRAHPQPLPQAGGELPRIHRFAPGWKLDDIAS